MKIMKILVGVASLFAIVLFFLFVKFVAIPEFTSKTVTKQYTINSIYTKLENPEDIMFGTKEDAKIMYINRGLETHSLDYFKNHLLNKSSFVTVQYFKKSGSGRIIRIESNGVEVYNKYEL